MCGKTHLRLRLRVTQKALQLPFQFVFFPSRHFFWSDCQKLFRERFKISYQEMVWARSDSFLGHTKECFRKNCSSSCYSRHVWHMTRLIHGNQHSQDPKKHKEQPESRKQVR